MNKFWIIFTLLIISLLPAFSQTGDKSYYVLDSVELTGLSSKPLLKAYHHFELPDSITGNLSLPRLLTQNTTIFVKEYGKAMLASISLRGTGASHTQIVWNGIPVNSILTGQTDLNTFSPAGFDRIILKKGGSSVSYGSGAIGGVVVFEDRIRFYKTFHLINQTKIGSFNTGLNNFKIVKANHKWYGKLNLQWQKSKNNYPYPGYQVSNENGAYQGLDYATTIGYHINNQHRIYFKSKLSYWNRETSRTLYMPQNAKLLTGNQRLLTGWLFQHRHLSAQTDLAYLYENFDYYPHKNNNAFSHSQSRIYLIKNLLTWSFDKSKKIMVGNEWQHQQATGDHINRHTRQNYAVFGIWSQQISHLTYQLKLRQDINSGQRLPVTGAVAASYKFNPHHSIRVNVSKNYRLPTFNDLYWTPGGNPDLKPEDSYGFEAGYDLQWNHSQLQLTAFYINSQNLIKWTPGNNGFWQPNNIEQAVYKGLELNTSKSFNINSKLNIENKTGIAYRQAVNLKNKKQLPFTPQLTGQNTLRIMINKFAVIYHYRYQGKIYTTTSNTKFLPAYHLHNVSLTYNYNRHFKFEIGINNLANAYYENVPTRPQPGRNYEFLINFKI